MGASSQVAQQYRIRLPGRRCGLIPESLRSPGEENSTYTSMLAWEIPWTEESDGLQSMGLQRVRYDFLTKQHQVGYTLNMKRTAKI